METDRLYMLRIMHSSVLTFAALVAAIKLLLSRDEVIERLYAPEAARLMMESSVATNLFVPMATVYATIALLTFGIRDNIAADRRISRPVHAAYLVLIASHAAWFVSNIQLGLFALDGESAILFSGTAAVLGGTTLFLLLNPPRLQPIDDDARPFRATAKRRPKAD